MNYPLKAWDDTGFYNDIHLFISYTRCQLNLRADVGFEMIWLKQKISQIWTFLSMEIRLIISFQRVRRLVDKIWRLIGIIGQN